MMKHLSATRHKTVIDTQTGEEIACEECNDTNVHQLQIIRFGGEDMTLICNSCFQKQFGTNEKPTTAYDLKNGSLLNFWDKYLKVRECCCTKCGKDSKLNVNSKGDVLCDDCLTKVGGKLGSDYISESTGKFLYRYLGIKEPTSTSSSSSKKFKRKGGRKVGRGKRGGGGAKGARGGKKSDGGKEKKPLTYLQKLEKEAFKTKKENSIIESSSTLNLRSFKGVKATTKANLTSQTLQDSSPMVKDTKAINKQQKNKPTSGKENVSKGNKPTAANGNVSKGNKPTPGKENVSKGNKPTAAKGNISKGNKPTPGKENVSKGNKPTAAKGNISKGNKPTATKENTSKGKKANEKKNKVTEVKQTKMAAEKSGSSSSTSSLTSRDSEKKASSNRDHVASKTTKHEKNKRKEQTLQKQRPSSKDTTSTIDSWGVSWDLGSDGSNETTPATSRGSTPQPVSKAKEQRATPKKKQDRDAEVENLSRSASQIHFDTAQKQKAKKMEEIEEGIPLAKFVKYKPKLTYPDLKTYCDEFSYALFLEQKLENTFIEDFQILWPKRQEENVFVVQINKNAPGLDTILPPHLAQFVKIPFNERQPLMLSSNDESHVWYTFVKEVGTQGKKIILLLELFSWNKLSLPIQSGSEQFKLLPVSAQANRILFAMTRIKNPKFIDLLLGSKPIYQLQFNNRLKFNRDTLNESQRKAVQHVLNNRITVIQGPPGTGKTSTIEEVILQLIENFHSFPILCVAASNIAIDNIAEKIIETRPNIKSLRILSDKKESQYGPDHPLGKICLHNMVYDRLSPEMREIASKLRSDRRGEVSRNQDNKFYTETTNISNKLIAQAQILFTTNITAGGRQLKVIKELPVVIMDESTQSSEASTLVPLSLPGIKNFVFVGDEKQLSSFSNIPQLEMSLFERILANGSYREPNMLDTQYRMHPRISDFPIKKFYHGKLKDGVTAENKMWDGIQYPLFFYQCDKGPEGRVVNNQNGMRAFTYNNIFECQEIIKLVYKLYLEKNVKLEDIGIITPYSSQRDLLSQMFVKDAVVNPLGKGMLQETDEAEFLNSRRNDIQSHTVNIINGLHVATVDSFQGHEKNFIIFSCVRNNAENKIGFLRDRRRLNVALTRAKNGLIVVGNKEVLKRGDHLWRDFVQYLEEQEVVFDSLDVY